MELSGLLQTRTSARFWGGKKAKLPTDPQYAIYISHHYAGLLTNTAVWSSPFVMAIIKGDARKFAEQSVAEHPAPTATEIAEADAAVGQYVPKQQFFTEKLPASLPAMVLAASLLFYVGLPALVAALLFRGGVVLLIAGVTYVRKDGLRASRLRLLWRSLVAWSPAVPDVRFGGCRARQALGLATVAGAGIARPVGGSVSRLARTRFAGPPGRHLAGAAVKRFMKNIIIVFLTVTTITLAAVCVVQSRKSAGERSQVAALQGELEAASQQVEDLEAAQKRAEKQRHELLGQAEELAAQLQARELVETNVTAPAPPPAPPVADAGKADEEKGGLGKMISKMMQDPNTRKFIQQQQRMMMDQMYGPLVKQLGLTPEEATQFKDMLVDNGMKAAEKATSVFGDAGATNRTEMLSSLSAEQKSFDEQVKTLLGDDRYAQ